MTSSNVFEIHDHVLLSLRLRVPLELLLRFVQLGAVPGFYKSSPTKHQYSAEKVTVEKKNDREGAEQTSGQVDESRAQPSRDEQGEQFQNRVNSDDVGDKELRQTVTQLNSSLTGNCNGKQELIRNDVSPPNVRNNDFHLNEIGAALKDVDCLENPTKKGNYTCPESRPDAPTGDSRAKQKLKGIIPSAENPELNPDGNPRGTSSVARDNQHTPRVSLQANKPRWTRFVRANNKPSEEVSLDKPSKKKRIAAISEDHSKLPNKRYQVSRNEEDTANCQLVKRTNTFLFGAPIGFHLDGSLLILSFIRF
nr:hypothetical protein CFP56_05371 [Quercus suber]